MMGTCAKLNGDEWDAFSRRGRKMLVWRTGETHRIKRRFWNAVRLEGKREMRWMEAKD